jgi:hypothetical protein
MFLQTQTIRLGACDALKSPFQGRATMADGDTAFDPDGFGLAALMLCGNLLAHLKSKGVISGDDALNVVDYALVQLEEGQSVSPPSSRPRIASSRRALDALRQRLGNYSGSSKPT